MTTESKIISFEQCTHFQTHPKRYATNGCFDILHAGHVKFLESIKAAVSETLIVGVNSDESVRALKGEGRPVFPLADRLQLLAALECVDWVLPFDGLTAQEFLQRVRPGVWVKGGDYTLDTLNQDERRTVELNGGIIRLVPHTGESTTAIINRIRAKPAP